MQLLLSAFAGARLDLSGGCEGTPVKLLLHSTAQVKQTASK